MDNSFSISNSSLEAMENYLRGDGKLNEWTECGGHGDMSYNRTSDTRYDTVSVNPHTNENSTIRDRTRLCSNMKKTADDIENIPLTTVMDSLSDASQNVSLLTQRKLNAPPVPVLSAKKTKFTNAVENNERAKSFLKPYDEVQVFEIWKVFLEKNDEDLDSVYIIVSADYSVQGYANGKWSNVEYRGFYTTLDEAKNEISGYLR